jgi:3-phosphoshikimate 1-carboxyvinyltransferase
MAAVRVAPVTLLRGTLQVPPDKSLTHRAIMLAGVSDREVGVGRPLDSADTGATLQAVEDCGVPVTGHLGDAVRITGRGLRGLCPPPALDCANAGTLMRLFAGILVGQRIDHVVLDGDASLRGRPMTRVARPLRAMGAQIFTAPGGTPPLVVNGGAPLRGVEHHLEVASAQVKSCLLLAGLFAEGTTWVHEPVPSRDHTERMLEASGVTVLREGGAIGVTGPVEGLSLPDMEVPGDFSSAAAHLVAGALLGDPEVRLEGVNLNPGRTGLLAVMRRMGVEIREEVGEPVAGEPCGTLSVSRTDDLRATEVEPHEVPSMIDELPLVGLLGALAAGTTVVRGAAELRVKESDRIASVVRALRGLGVDAQEREDGFSVTGGAGIRGGSMDSVGDHRLAMLGAVAGLVSREGVSVGDFGAVAVSYPGFARDLAGLGAVPA